MSEGWMGIGRVSFVARVAGITRVGVSGGVLLRSMMHSSVAFANSCVDGTGNTEAYTCSSTTTYT